MDKTVIKRLLDTYGANITRWPTNACQSFEPMLKDIDIQQALDEAKQLDALLDASTFSPEYNLKKLTHKITTSVEPSTQNANYILLTHQYSYLPALGGIIGALLGLSLNINQALILDQSLLDESFATWIAPQEEIEDV